MTNESSEIRLNRKSSETAKHNIKVEKDMPDVKPNLMDLQNSDQYLKKRVSNGTSDIGECLGNISAVLSGDGQHDHTSSVSSPCQGYDLVNTSSIDWCRGESTKELLQLVNTDHPYRCQRSDDLQFPTKSSSCSSIPDAELMQDFFLHTTNMISYQPIAELGCLPAPQTATTLIGFDHGTSESVLNTVTTNQSGSQAINPSHVGRPPNAVYKGSEYGQGNAVSRHVANVNGTSSTRAQVSIENSPQKSEHCGLPTGGTSASAGTANVDKAAEGNGPCKTMDISLHQGKRPQCTEKADNSTSGPDKPVEDRSNDNSSICSDQVSTPSKRNKYCKKGESRWQKMESEKHLWMSACRALSDKVEEDIILNSAVNLMVKMWTDYLNLTFEEVRQREIETARELNQCDEVIEMLEDRGRYVWQIIEEDIKPKTYFDVDNESMQFL